MTTAEEMRIAERLAHVEATLPHLATKADLAALELRLLLRLGGVLAIGVGLILGAMRLWL